ncbi:DUF6597 domain-containing transcriptional factor [[Actinomadura] parvosata]|uniref:DUF6597 domain-containing transcriptional factor n=1 Tax=[Actinomadura] parvosata TaxID=1955412 RepID=UPI00406BE793
MYVERPPSAALADRLACGWHRISEAGTTQLVVPDACVDLIWSAESLYVAGPDTGPMPATLQAGETLVAVRFRPGAVGDFFGVPLHELRDRRVPLDALPMGRDLLTRLADAPDVPSAGETRSTPPSPHPLLGAAALDERRAQAEARLQLLQRAVASRLATGEGRASVDPAAPAIATALRKGRSVSEVAWHLGYSERQLQRRSVHAFGYAPKTLQRIVRFQRALRLARAGRPLAEVAATAGYTDQAHLANDVKRLSGVQMSRLL